MRIIDDKQTALGEDHASATTWSGRGQKERLVAILEMKFSR
jgi:hypothetical protein